MSLDPCGDGCNDTPRRCGRLLRQGLLGEMGQAAVKSPWLRLGIVTLAPLAPKGQNVTV